MRILLVGKVISLLSILFMTGCGLMATTTIYYYTPSSDGGILESSSFGVSRFSSRDGLPDLITFKEADSRIQVSIVNQRIIPLHGGPILLPIIPLFPLTPFLHQKTISKERPLVLRIKFKEFPPTFLSTIRLTPENITVRLKDSAIQLKLTRIDGYWNSTEYKDYSLNQDIVIRPLGSSVYINLVDLYYAYMEEEEPKEFLVSINGLYVDTNRIVLPDIRYTITHDTVVSTDH